MTRILSISLLLIFVTLIAHCHSQLFVFEDFDNSNYVKILDTAREERLQKQFAQLNDRENYRLNDDTYPINYDVSIFPNSTESGEYFGQVYASFKANKEVSSVVVNIEGITINDATVYDRDVSTSVSILDHCDSDTWAQYGKVECKLLEGQTFNTTRVYILYIEFTATLWKDNRGLYPSYYFDTMGQKKELLTTHFGQQARRLFPCWDEPKFKASFAFYIFRDPMIHKVSISNANLAGTVSQGLWEVDIYKPTTDISTYILAIIISDFHVRTDGNPRGKHKFAVFARANALEQTLFAQDIGPKLIEAFNDWTGINYYEFKEVEKMDMAAIPDFSAGAMENWGLMIHREVNILYDQRYTTSLQRQRIALVISHEVSHMWFGDLVTCDWWDATWLNEGFARYFQFIAMEAVDPYYQGLLQFPVSTTFVTMLTDATPGAHPLTNTDNIWSYADIRTMFDTITYDKGGSILRMTHNLMGEDKFKAAIREYLNKHAYKTAVPDALITVFEKAAPNQNLAKIVTSFTIQSGVPLVTVERNGNKIVLTQKRFFTNPEDEGDNQRWNIPITVATKPEDFNDTLSHLTLFPATSSSLEIELPSDADWYLLNVQSFGYYRVHYDQANWMKIKNRLNSENFGGIHAVNRAQIIDDLFQLARAGYVTYDVALDIIGFVRNDKHYLPWLATISGLSYLQQRIPNAEYKAQFEFIVRDLLEKIYDHLSFKDEGDHLDWLNRANIINWACKYNIGDCRGKAFDEFNLAFNEGKITHPDISVGAYCSEVRVEGSEAFTKLYHKYNTSNYATEQATILNALGCANNAEDVNRLMDKIISTEIRLHDKSATYAALYQSNLENVDLVLDYIEANTAKWGEVMSLSTTLSDLSTRFIREEQFKRLEDFVATPAVPDADKERIRAAITRNRKNLDWDDKRLKEIVQHYKFLSGSSSVATLSTLVIFLAVTVRLLL